MVKSTNNAVFKPHFSVDKLWVTIRRITTIEQNRQFLVPQKITHNFSTKCILLITVENHKSSLNQYAFEHLFCGENCYIEIMCGNLVNIYVK
jgi:hypothetical protein